MRTSGTRFSGCISDTACLRICLSILRRGPTCMKCVAFRK